MQGTLSASVAILELAGGNYEGACAGGCAACRAQRSSPEVLRGQLDPATAASSDESDNEPFQPVQVLPHEIVPLKLSDLDPKYIFFQKGNQTQYHNEAMRCCRLSIRDISKRRALWNDRSGGEQKSPANSGAEEDFENFFTHNLRKPGSTLLQFCTEFDEKLRRLQAHGVKLPTTVQGKGHKAFVAEEGWDDLDEAFYQEDHGWEDDCEAPTIESWQDDDFGFDQEARYYQYDNEHEDGEEGFVATSDGPWDIDEYDSAYASYLDGRKRFSDLKLSRGYLPIVALQDDTNPSSTPSSPQRPHKGKGPRKGKGGKKGRSSTIKYPSRPGGKAPDPKARSFAAIQCLRCGASGHMAAKCPKKDSALHEDVEPFTVDFKTYKSQEGVSQDAGQTPVAEGSRKIVLKDWKRIDHALNHTERQLQAMVTSELHAPPRPRLIWEVYAALEKETDTLINGIQEAKKAMSELKSRGVTRLLDLNVANRRRIEDLESEEEEIEQEMEEEEEDLQPPVQRRRLEAPIGSPQAVAPALNDATQPAPDDEPIQSEPDLEYALYQPAQPGERFELMRRRYDQQETISFGNCKSWTPSASPFTAPGTEADGCFDKGEDLDACYLGSAEVANATRPFFDWYVVRDTEHRLRIMSEVLDRAYASKHWDRSPTTLKIFLAPEFYWRGQKGAYRIGSSTFSAASKSAVEHLSGKVSHPQFKHWVVVPGTVVMVQHADERYVQMSGRPFENISYYNFAPIHIGGTKLMYLKFKHFISSIDFLQVEPGQSRQVRTPPGSAEEFCKRHPHSNGCIYRRLDRSLLDRLGFEDFRELIGGVLNIGARWV
ncbi:Glyceraldehyde-3-phosphate dehydrogenase [Durusdinium trenchii]|uniref:Chloroplastic n=1 Tax=Durusdinium trenchii TaxID=1381693 RepID=A0ABP0NAM3_9DINO